MKRILNITPLFDCVLLNVSIICSFLLEFGGWVSGYYPVYAISSTVVRLAFFVLFGIYRAMTRYTSPLDILNLIKAITIGTFVMGTSTFIFTRTFPLILIVGEWMLDVILLGGVRLFLPQINQKLRGKSIHSKRTLVIGAGDAGEMIVREIKSHPEYGYTTVGFIDDDTKKLKKSIHGIKVLGTKEDINNIVKSKQIEQILIAIPSAPGHIIREIIERCAHTRASFKIVPGIREIIIGDVNISQIKDIEPEDLLGRETVEVDISEVGNYLSGKCVLITGAGGSIGKEIARQVSKINPKMLVLFGKGENSLYETNLEIGQDTRKAIAVGDIRDRNCVSQVIKEYKPRVIFHAAAHKHVSLMEKIPEEAVKNNIIGTKIVAEEAIKNGVERFLMISTDKAVYPVSVMGMTKKIAELLIQSFSLKNSSTCFATIRFGNVIGSRGSVVPLFKYQISKGGPVTITHPDATRYFMSIKEASLLVIQAGKIAKGGETFILDMGEPIKISTLARDLIILSGYEPNVDIEIKYIGLENGEKLSEELMTEEEKLHAVRYDHLLIVPQNKIIPEHFEEVLETMVHYAKEGKRKELLDLMKFIIKQSG